MTSVLVMTPAYESTPQYVTQCVDVNLRFVALTQWLTNNGFGLCTRAEYDSPDLLAPNVNYCVISDIVSLSSYLLFQCLPTPDWPEGGDPAPNYTANIGDLRWLVVPAV